MNNNVLIFFFCLISLYILFIHIFSSNYGVFFGEVDFFLVKQIMVF